MESCEYCGREFNNESEGHIHTDCQCKICDNSDILKDLCFCSPECECNYLNSVL